MLDLRRLRLLRELSRLGTVTAVAEANGYSPSAVSQQLAALAKQAGVELLAPAGRRVRLTPQALVLVEHTEVLLEQIELTQAALARARDTLSGTVRVAAFQTAAMALFPPAIRTLAHDHPDLRVELTELEPEIAIPALVSGEFDLVLGEEYPGRPLPRHRQTQRADLLADELRLVVPAAWPQRSLATLRERPFAAEPRGAPPREWMTALCRSAGFEPDVRYTTTDLQIHLKLVADGLAAAVLPDLAGARDHPGTTTRRLPGRPTRQIFATTRRGAGNHPALEAVTTAIRSGSG